MSATISLMFHTRSVSGRLSVSLSNVKSSRPTSKPKARKPTARKAPVTGLERQYEKYFGGDEYGVSALPDSGTVETPVLFEIRQFATYGAYEDPV